MTKKTTLKEVELAPDAWERFERAVGAVVKAPPQHRAGPTKVSTKRKAKKKA